MESILANEGGQETSIAAAAEKRDLLARLLARLAHEIRNPLSSLDIHAQLLEEDLAASAPELKEKLTPRFGIIHGELHRLKSIVTQFLRLAGPSALDVEQLEVAQVVSHICELLRPEAASRQIKIGIDMAPGLPAVEADRVKLAQALMNLLINAMQAVDRDGQINVSVSSPGQMLRIEVTDTGPGIKPEHLPSIFDPYYTTKEEGHGLGLWIAQQIIAAHSGSIQVRNAEPHGAVFTLLIPMTQPCRVSPAEPSYPSDCG